MQLDLLFQIAGVGILTTVVASVLNSSGPQLAVPRR